MTCGSVFTARAVKRVDKVKILRVGHGNFQLGFILLIDCHRSCYIICSSTVFDAGIGSFYFIESKCVTICIKVFNVPVRNDDLREIISARHKLHAQFTVCSFRLDNCLDRRIVDLSGCVVSDFADRLSVILHVELELSGFECSILHCLLTFRCSLTFSLVDIDECIRKFKDAIFSSDCSIIHIRNNINCTVSVIGHSDSQIIGMIVICDAIRGGLRSLLTYRVIVLCIPFSVCSSLVEEVRININRVLAILFDDLCGILVSSFFTVFDNIIDLREYDVTLIDILVSVLRRNNSVVRIIQCQIELKLFDSELSAFDLLLDTENQSAFSLILIFKVREVNVVVCICRITINRNRFDNDIGFIRIQSYSYNDFVLCNIICNTTI